MRPIKAGFASWVQAGFVDASVQPGDKRAISLMIVDDDAGLLAALRFAFETAGVSVDVYPSAEAALAAASKAHDCLVLDQRLPGLTGLDLLERLRSRGERAPAILITSNPVAAVRAKARAAGVEIVEKPLLQDALMTKVMQLV